MALDFAKMEQMSETVQRFKVADGETNVPILVLRHPDDDSVATRPMRKHWLDKPDGKSLIVPCSQVLVNKPCFVDGLREGFQANGLYGTVDKDTKKFLDGSTSHEMQLIDFRGEGMSLLQRYLAAGQAKDTAGTAAALSALQAWIIVQPVKLWGFSRTVYEIISREIRSSMQEFFKQIDPTEAGDARIFWVSKPKQADGASRFGVSVKWGMVVPIPACVYTNVKKYSDLFDETAKGCSYWDARRVRESLLAANREDILQAAGSAGASLPPAQTRVALPPASSERAAMPGSAQPSAPVNQESAAAPLVLEGAFSEVQAGATVSAADQACFGVSPNFASPTCTACPQMDECLKAARTKLAKPTAPAAVAAVVMPKAPTAPATPGGGDRIAAMVADALAKANGKGK